jgi:hypothetical protein
MQTDQRFPLPPRLLRECRAKLLIVAPEFGQAPLYVANLPVDHPETGDAQAFTTRGAPNLFVRDQLIAEGLWQGCGTTITFCKPLSHYEALGITLHEAAHNLPLEEPRPDVEPTAADKARQGQLIATLLQRPVGTLATMPAWYEHHGLRFIRRCLHLHRRAWLAGFEIGLPEICFAGHHYDLSPAWKYMHALGDEPRRMRSATFAEIEVEPMSAQFRELFHADYAQWCERPQSEPTIDTTEIQTDVRAA